LPRLSSLAPANRRRGLLFVPTTIDAMVWATPFLHNGQHISVADAATDASMVPIGWVIGCPLLGYISDLIGRRKPVLMGGALVMLAAALSAVYPKASSLDIRCRLRWASDLVRR